MDYTQNLHLPQFAETDRIHHDDFNDAFDKLDTAALIVPLRTITLTEDATQVNIDLSEHDWAKFPRVLLRVRGEGSSSYVRMFANQYTGSHYARYYNTNYYEHNNFGSIQLTYTYQGNRHVQQSDALLMSTPLQYPRCRVFSYGAGTSDTIDYIYYLEQEEPLTSLQIGDGDSTIFAGSSFTLYGIRL